MYSRVPKHGVTLALPLYHSTTVPLCHKSTCQIQRKTGWIRSSIRRRLLPQARACQLAALPSTPLCPPVALPAASRPRDAPEGNKLHVHLDPYTVLTCSLESEEHEKGVDCRTHKTTDAYLKSLLNGGLAFLDGTRFHFDEKTQEDHEGDLTSSRCTGSFPAVYRSSGDPCIKSDSFSYSLADTDAKCPFYVPAWSHTGKCEAPVSVSVSVPVSISIMGHTTAVRQLTFQVDNSVGSGWPPSRMNVTAIYPCLKVSRPRGTTAMSESKTPAWRFWVGTNRSSRKH